MNKASEVKVLMKVVLSTRKRLGGEDWYSLDERIEAVRSLRQVRDPGTLPALYKIAEKSEAGDVAIEALKMVGNIHAQISRDEDYEEGWYE